MRLTKSLTNYHQPAKLVDKSKATFKAASNMLRFPSTFHPDPFGFDADDSYFDTSFAQQIRIVLVSFDVLCLEKYFAPRLNQKRTLISLLKVFRNVAVSPKMSGMMELVS